MNVMDKYYIPTIDEFRTRFEYECESTQYPDKNNWHPEIFYLNDSHISLVKTHMVDNKVRVKYLDFKDIMALGVLKLRQDVDDECHFISGKTFIGLSTGDDKKLHIYYDPDRNTMSIWYRANKGFEYTLFDGIIKNLSEFKVLLKQLDIDYE